MLARSLLIFGLHVHVAVPDRSAMIDLMNEARYFLPHLLALSTSSPFWMGRDTGLKSFRTTVFRRYHRALIEENKWRAARWGIDGKLIDFGKRREVPMRDLALELLEFVDDVVDDLRSRREVEYVKKILADGTSAERQVDVYRHTGDLRAVVQSIVEETRESVEQSARTYKV